MPACTTAKAGVSGLGGCRGWAVRGGGGGSTRVRALACLPASRSLVRRATGTSLAATTNNLTLTPTSPIPHPTDFCMADVEALHAARAQARGPDPSMYNGEGAVSAHAAALAWGGG